MKDGKMKAVKDSIGLMPRPHYETFKVIIGHLGKFVKFIVLISFLIFVNLF